MTITAGTTPAPRSTRVAQGGPPLLAPAAAFAALTLAGLAIGVGGPRPTTPAADVLSYYAGHPTLGSLAGMLVFGSSMPLAIWAATAYRRLRRLGVTAPGSAMALAGGVLSAAALALSGLLTWTAAQTAQVAGPGVARALVTLAFGAGAAGFAVPFALLLAGLAVPALILRLLPRPLAITGLAIAAVGMVSTLMLVFPALYVLTPIVRFGGLLWLLAAAVLLPRTRARRPVRDRRTGEPIAA